MAKNDGWVPLDKNLTKFLPRDREYTELEAMFSLQKDINEENVQTTRAYARLWQWGRTRTKTFLTNCGLLAVPGPCQDRATTEPHAQLILFDLQKPPSHYRATTVPGPSHYYNNNNNNNIKKSIATKKSSRSHPWENSKEPATCQEFVEYCRKSTSRHVHVIGEWADELKPDFKTRGQWWVFWKQNLQGARALQNFSKEQIAAGIKRMRNATYLDKAQNTNTLIKYVVDQTKK